MTSRFIQEQQHRRWEGKRDSGLRQIRCRESSTAGLTFIQSSRSSGRPQVNTAPRASTWVGVHPSSTRGGAGCGHWSWACPGPALVQLTSTTESGTLKKWDQAESSSHLQEEPAASLDWFSAEQREWLLWNKSDFTSLLLKSFAGFPSPLRKGRIPTVAKKPQILAIWGMVCRPVVARPSPGSMLEMWTLGCPRPTASRSELDEGPWGAGAHAGVWEAQSPVLRPAAPLCPPLPLPSSCSPVCSQVPPLATLSLPTQLSPGFCSSAWSSSSQEPALRPPPGGLPNRRPRESPA